MPTDRLSGYNNGVAMKIACSVATTGSNITLSGVQTIDGVSVGNNEERVLVKNQTTTTQNGIYVAQSSSWVRARDCDGNKDILPGSLVYVDRGSANGRSFWAFNSSSTAGTITVGTDAIALSNTNLAVTGVSSWVSNNWFPITSSSDGRALLGAVSSTALTDVYTSIFAVSTAIDRYDVINVKSTAYGAVGNGTTNDGPSIQAALTAATGGKVVYFPAGTYKCSTALTVPDGVQLQGANPFSSIINTTSLNNNVLNLGVSGRVSHLQIKSTANRTGGSFISAQGNGICINDCQFYGYHNAINVGTGTTIQPVGCRIIDCNFALPSTAATAGGSAILLSFYSNAVIDRCIISGTDSGQQPDSGIRVIYGDTAYITDTNVTRHGYGLYVTPTTGLGVYALRVSGSLFDSAGQITSGSFVDSARFQPATGAGIFDTLITNTWFGLASSGNGLVLAATAGQISGCQFSNCQFVANGVSGLVIQGTAADFVNVTGGYASASTAGAGISITGGARYVSITGFQAGSAASRGANLFGIAISTHLNTFFSVVGNNLLNNGTPLSNGATSTSVVVANNLTA